MLTQNEFTAKDKEVKRHCTNDKQQQYDLKASKAIESVAKEDQK